jgi:hypothetical protein
MFNRSIHEIINAFMKTRPIFQPPHFRDIMDLQRMLCTITIGGEGSQMCEIDLDPKPMHTMFNVNGNLISDLATPTTVPYNPTTPIVPNSLVTLIVLFNENASEHQDGAFLQSPITPHVHNNSTKKGTRFSKLPLQHSLHMLRFHQWEIVHQNPTTTHILQV